MTFSMIEPSMPRPSSTKPVKQTPATIVIGILGFVVFPALITAVAPVSYIRFEKRGDGVAATVKQCLLLVIPFQTKTIYPVEGLDERVREARRENADERRRNNGKKLTIEGEGTLVILGPNDESAAASVSPVSIKSVREKAEAFLRTPTEKPLDLFVVANWKFSLLMGGAATFFTVLYLVGAMIAVPLWFIRKLSPAGAKSETPSNPKELE